MTTDPMGKIIAGFGTEVLYFIQPVAAACMSVDGLKDLLAEMGYDPVPNDLAALLSGIGAMNPPLTDSLQQVVAGGPNLVPNLAALLGRIRDLDQLQGINAIIGAGTDFFDELFDRLCYRYMLSRAPISVTLVDALGVLERRVIRPTDPGGRQVKYTSVRLNWDVLGLFFTDNRQWAYNTYGWGPNPAGGAPKGFDHVLAIQRISNIVRATQLAMVYEQTLTTAEKQQFLKGAGTDNVMRMNLPFWQQSFSGFRADGTPNFAEEIGLTLLPYGDLARKDNIGLAVAPYAQGNSELTLPLGTTLGLRMKAQVSGTGGAYVTAQPSGLGVEAGASVSMNFEFSALYGQQDGSPTFIFGDPTSTNLRVDRIVGTIGGSIEAATAGAPLGDVFVAAGVEGLAVSLDMGQDGLLSSVIPEPIEIDAGDLLVGWRTGRGVYFEGGTSLSVTVPLDLPLGPITLYEATVGLDWSAALRADFMITADLTLGPLYAWAENIGISAQLSEAADGSGVLGKYDLGFSFIPPTGYAIALDAGVVSGGGLLSVTEDEYRGALALKFATFGISAFAILNTRLPGGKKGFSLAASLFADINVPLAYGFFLTGLGGVIGINRSVDTDALRDVLFEGRLDNLLFPSDPIENAATILDDMAAVLPAHEGQHLFGPVARISWGVPQIIDIKLGIVLEVGQDFRLLILGGLGLNLPDRNVGLVALNLSFFGEVDFTAGTVSFDATLQGSRILVFTVTGDMALRTGWGKGITHIASFGGLHPKYPRPPNLPDLRPLSIAFGSNNPKITLSAYQAIALNAVMFGARADLYAQGPKITFVGQVAAKGFVSFDALIYFDPFAFDVLLAGGLSLLVDGDVKAELGFRLSLQGPNTFRISGDVWVKIFGIKVEFGITHSWGERQAIALPQINAASELRAALEKSKGFEPVQNPGTLGGVSFAPVEDGLVLIDPVGGMRLIQTTVPLDLTIQKIGEAQLTGPKKLELEILLAGQRQTLTPEKADFVRSHFFRTDESEKLRLPSFEQHKAGYQFSSTDLSLRPDLQIAETYAYEVIEIEADPEDPKLARLGRQITPGQLFADRFSRVTYGERLRPQTSLASLLTPSRPITVTEPGFVSVAAVDSMAPVRGGMGAIVDQINRLPELRDTLSEVAVVSTPSVRVVNDQVRGYIAANALKEAL